MRQRRVFHAGEPVVFCMIKRSTRPGPRARDVRPEPAGDGYRYHVDKFWLVREVRGDQLVLATRRGKLHVVDANDPCIRKPRWIERFVYADRFPRSDDPTPLPTT